jgi:tetratricopeptide (TPR) repeat protein/predicted Ser/Thr protein kinase
MLEAGDSIGRYRIVDLIGSGGMGQVYLAEDTELRRRVAVKMFTRDLPAGSGAPDHLLHEARAASALSHPNVCTVFEVGEDEGRAYIVMEYVAGRTLDALIAGRDLPAERVARYGAQIADAIAHAHAHGVVHRDLKSANVVITNDGRAKVLDFGLASTNVSDADPATRDVTSAEAGRISGTLSYMAPEVLRGQQADARSDIWALGVILYETATGRLPFGGETAFEVSTAVMKESAELPAELPPGLRAVILRCLEKAPGERYQSAAEVRAALETLQTGSTSSGEPVSADVEAAARATEMPGWLPFAAAFSLVAVIALAGWVVFGPDRGGMGGAAGAEATATASPGIGASGRPTIAVLPFRDRTGSQDLAWLAEGVPSMLLTSLAQTEGLDVVSNSRVQEIVAQLGQQTLQELDAGALAEFARRSGAGAVVVGDLYYTGSEHRFEVQVEDVAGGRVLDAHSASGPFVFDLVDRLAAEIVAGLQLEGAEPAGSIADVTTDSLDAWRHYDEGLRAGNNLRYGDAVRAFEQALAADPDFVMAHYQLARLEFSLSDPSRAREYDEYVIANLDRVPERDRLLVEGMFAYEHDEDPVRAEQRLEELVRRYPDHETGWLRLARVQRGGVGELGSNERQIATLQRGVTAIPASGMLHNQLGYYLADNGRYPEAVRAIERYVELYPEEPNAYDSLAEMYVLSGQPETAFEKYGDALEVDPGWASGYYGRAVTAAMLGRYEDALEEVEKFREAWTASNAGPLSLASFVKAMLLSKLGRYDEALQIVRAERRIAVDIDIPLYQKSIEMAGVHIALESEDASTARAFIENVLDGVEAVDVPAARRDIETSARSLRGVIATRSGDMEQARGVLVELRRATRGDSEVVFGADLLAAELALAGGDLRIAEQMFRAAEPPLKAFYSASTGPPTLLANNHVFRDGIARVRVAEGNLDAAIRIYRSLITVDIGSKYNAFLDPRYVLRLAELLDAAGRTDEARAQYLRFAELWEGADERFQPTVTRARERAAEIG